MKVFVSSTVYDLIDIRAELDAVLRELGVSPVLSDDKLSDFDSKFDANSIETCLLNVQNSDAVIVVLDKRYGPRLGKFGFDDVSATHLEYRHAKKHSKPVHFYVRDRLEADYNIHHRNKTDKDLYYAWCKDTGLFEFLAEHRKLCEGSKLKNWVSFYTDSTDLKAAVRRDFEPVIKPQTLLNAIEQNLFPLFTSEVDAEYLNVGGSPFAMGVTPAVKCILRLRNVGRAPAFGFTFVWKFDEEPQKPETKDLVASGQEVRSTTIYNLNFGPQLEAEFHVEYRTAIGVLVREKYRVFLKVHDDTSMIAGASLLNRTYHNSARPEVVIHDA